MTTQKPSPTTEQTTTEETPEEDTPAEEEMETTEEPGTGTTTGLRNALR